MEARLSGAARFSATEPVAGGADQAFSTNETHIDHQDNPTHGRRDTGSAGNMWSPIAG